jgi:Ni/Fe-hydrogenase subunit HybB-like protein
MATSDSQMTTKLLSAGMIAGPFFIVVSLVQAFTREGFDWIRHPASLLSLGNLGFIQIANFVITGALFIACAVGLKRIVTAGVGRKWLARLFVLVGVAFILGGVFVADPAFGFPPGTPEGMPKTMSWHSMIHGFAPVIGSLAMSAALLIFARRSLKQGRRVAAIVSVLVVMISFVLSSLPQITGDWEKGEFNFLPLWIGATLLYCYPAVFVSTLKADWVQEH